MNEVENQPAAPVFSIEKLYVKDLSLEIPHAPGIFLEREQPQIELQLHSQAIGVENGVYEVTVTVTVTARLAEKDRVMFLIEAKQAGIFQLANLPSEETDTVLGVVCPNILYPYLREVVSDASVRAGFAPVLLNPINFEVLHQQKKQQLSEAGAVPVTTH
jgi:preprotein translocase subunit SecB